MAKETIEKFEDFGLGEKASSGAYRALNKDGSFNVSKSNVPISERLNVFHSLISMSWAKFIGLIILGYLLVNLFFACIYIMVGVENLTAVKGSSGLGDFLEAFFFSAQTITTLGYGRVAPVGELANTVAAIESMLGLLSFALATGMLYGRFSKPSAKMKYSSCAVIAPYQNINGFMFRVVNPQDNQLLEVEVNVTVSMRREDSTSRDFHLLSLERSHIVFFPSIWTVVHPIDTSSPLHGLSEADLLDKDAEFIVMIKAFDESFSQTVYSRSSYKAHEIRWGEKFTYILSHGGDGINVDVGRINETTKMELNRT